MEEEEEEGSGVERALGSHLQPLPFSYPPRAEAVAG